MNIINALIALTILIFIHELGHYWAARATGVRVEEFAIGFGPAFAKFKRNGILYRLNLIPIGGYVKMLGEDNPEAANAPDNFNNRPLLARMLVIVAGVLMNLVGAFVILLLAFQIFGSPTGEWKDITAQKVLPDTPAQTAGVQAKDKFAAVNGKQIVTSDDFTTEMKANAGKPISLQVVRDNSTLTLHVTPTQEGKIGVELGGTPIYNKMGFGQSLTEAGQQTGRLVGLTVNGFVQLVTGHVGIKDLSGPVGIVQATGTFSAQGPYYFLYFMALLSINLAVFNMLPIPGLDGGRLLFLIVEGLRRGKRMTMEREASINMIGILFLLALMVIVTFQDIFKLLSR